MYSSNQSLNIMKSAAIRNLKASNFKSAATIVLQKSKLKFTLAIKEANNKWQKNWLAEAQLKLTFPHKL